MMNDTIKIDHANEELAWEQEAEKEKTPVEVGCMFAVFAPAAALVLALVVSGMILGDDSPAGGSVVREATEQGEGRWDRDAVMHQAHYEGLADGRKHFLAGAGLPAHQVLTELGEAKIRGGNSGMTLDDPQRARDWWVTCYAGGFERGWRQERDRVK